MTTQSLPLTIAAAGRTLLAAKIAAGESLVIDRIKLGVGRYTPTGLETDILTPFTPVREFPDPMGTSSGSTFQFVVQDTSSEVYNVGEFGVFSGATLFAISSRIATEPWLIQKSTGALVIPTTYQFTSLDAASVTFNVTTAYPLGSPDVAGMVKLSTAGDTAVTPAGMTAAIAAAVPSLWFGTQAAYDAIAVKNNETYYFIEE